MTAKAGGPGSPGTPAPADDAIAADLGAIDTAPLDRLLEVRIEETRLEDYRRRAEEKKDSVPEAVWQRVVADYARRLAAIEDQATPLRGAVRAEFQKLRALLDRVTARRDAAELEKAEIEFRHEVGELDDEQLESRRRGPTATLDQCRRDLDLVEAQRARFLTAFDSETDLLSAPPASPPATLTPPGGMATAPSGIAGRPSGQASPDLTLAPSAIGGPTSATPRASGAPPDATREVPAAAIANATSAVPLSPADAGGDHTFMMPVAALLISDGGPEAREYRLAAINYIGRSNGSQIMLARPGVSRKHALIVAGADGFTIRDLGSQNGTLVNGARIDEHALRNHDQIVIADATLTFRMPWPAADAAR